MTKCNHCGTGHLNIPVDEHPSYLVCDSCGAYQLTYTPQDYQAEFHSTPYVYIWDERTEEWAIRNQTLATFGGYGSAKSTASLNELFLRCLETPGTVALITAPTLQLLKRTSIKTLIDEIIPPPLLVNYNKSDGVIELLNETVIYTIPSDDEEKLRSINAGYVHMEEASGIKRSVYDQLLTRMRHARTPNRCMFVCSNPSLGWIKDVLVDNEDRVKPENPEHHEYDPSATTYIWETALNKYLPPDFIKKISVGKPEWWIAKFVKGSFKHNSGMVYPKFGDAVIDPIDLGPFWERMIALDHGFRNPTAVIWGTIDPKEGILYIFDEYYVRERTVPEHAKALKPKISEVPSGLMRFQVADPATQNRKLCAV